MADCSKTKVFFEELDRMCQSLEAQLCPLKHGSVTWFCDECEGMCFQETDFAIKTVQEWSDKHPIKTRQSEFLNLFPDACVRYWRDSCLVLDICPRELDKHFICKKSIFCADCQKDYWLAEVE